jgi:hypothetical protein
MSLSILDNVSMVCTSFVSAFAVLKTFNNESIAGVCALDVTVHMHISARRENTGSFLGVMENGKCILLLCAYRWYFNLFAVCNARAHNCPKAFPTAINNKM